MARIEGNEEVQKYEQNKENVREAVKSREIGSKGVMEENNKTREGQE